MFCKMNRVALRALAGLAVNGLLLLLPSSVLAGCRARQLPAAAATAVQAAFPDAKVTEVKQERERGATFYTVRLQQDGRQMELEIGADGVIGEIETRVALSDVPSSVATLIRSHVGNAKLDRVERHERRGIVRDGKLSAVETPAVSYEASYIGTDGRHHDIQVNADLATAPTDDDDNDNDNDNEDNDD